MIDVSEHHYPARPARTGFTLLFVLAVTLAAGAAAAGDPVVPLPAPGQTVPKHASGAWPSDTSSDEKPPRTAEQQARLDAVAGELKRIAETHGPDSVVLQSKLLIRSMGAGALGATEVRVAGPSTELGPSHLEIDVDTGIFFDEASTTAESRRDVLWKDIALPVLDEMTSFQIDPGALELVFLFEVQDAARQAGGKLSPTAEARCESFRVRIDHPTLRGISSDELKGDAVRGKVEMTPVAATTRAPRSPYPDPTTPSE